MKFIIAMDKFKGSLTSLEAGNAVKKGILRVAKNADVMIFPIADGGDGFANALKYYLKTDTITDEYIDALGRPIISGYEWSGENKTAIIELATCSGLAMLDPGERNPLKTSTYGTGMQIRHAISRGAVKIILGLGGSATNDAGTGILSALGFTFLNKEDDSLKPTGENLVHMDKIIVPEDLPEFQLEIACDVDNPLYGPQGAACIFAPQKGADRSQVHQLDDGLKKFAAVIEKHTGKNISDIPGTGAAGGVAAGLLPFFNVRMVKGIELILNASAIKQAIDNTSILITGEGKLDSQSLDGKTIRALAELAREMNIPCIGIFGKLELTEEEIKRLGLRNAFAIMDDSLTETESMIAASELLEKKAEMIIRYVNL